MCIDSRKKTGRAALAPLSGLLMLALLAGCAPQPFADDGLTKRSAALIGAASIPVEPKEFVRAERQAAAEYLPVGVTPPARAVAPRAAAAAAALEAELDAERKRSRDFANRPTPPASYDGSIPPRPAPPPKELLPQ